LISIIWIAESDLLEILASGSNMSYVRSRENTENYEKLPESSHFTERIQVR
jgi:hypothetical protein